MEWVRELFATAVLAVLLSFVVAKLVSVALAAGGDVAREPGSEPGEGVDRVPGVEDAKFEARLSSHRGSRCVEGVEFVRGTAGVVDRFGGEVASAGEVVEPVRCGEEVGTVRGEAVEESPAAAELPAEAKAEESVGASELVVDKESECRSGGTKEDGDRPSLEGEDEESQPHVPKSAETARAEQSDHEQEQIDKQEEVLRVDSDDDDDDDWEGIERSELEKKFAVAANYVDPANMDDRMESVGGDVKMQLYGLHKVATEGPCHEPQPMALMVSARAKCDGGKCLRCARNAWQRLGNMSPDVAMEQYISLLAENNPDWEVAKTTDDNKSDVAMPGAQDCNSSTISCDQLKCTDLREPSVVSVTGQIDLSKDEHQ